MPARHPRDLPRATPTPTPSSASGLPSSVLWFLEQLRRLPMGSWADAARRGEMARRPASAGSTLHAAGRARLRHAVDASPVLTSRIRARVHDIVGVLDGFLHPVDVLRMKKAALDAALAIAARSDLDPDDFARLYAPFDGLIPLHEPALASGGDDFVHAPLILDPDERE